ncbi:MAG: diadenylate cyclase CdaA [Candidatus Dadabacteria bacterium]|jgi:diadenylate cyclase|nr:diadenylate cyclase CdaA [Candidatus Dadabacteria bacterium]MCZ6555394.1 diadenylate cyclase CdaA [Candidatus Dadabacteria bacterium]MCZ6638429.1 diadenylate cyclase CdaA [Candidatus Dadabacteria bacterium]MCZ6685418.1 diadenylate cyclase CdaA [Candidatus Dadabacteria bacterium]MCZ6790650.1 diadenylate cyclase CdaA [Candidatus Dadabacteria bacterium]
MFDTILNFRYIWDTLDIVLVAFIIYYALTMIEGTRALQILFGLILLFALFYLSQGGLFTLNWILGQFLGSIILIVVILFQHDIRRGLAAIGRKPFLLKISSGKTKELFVEEVVKASSYLANRQIGALIVIERNNSLADFIEIGMRIDALLSRELIISIFNPSSPLHDGGIIIVGDRIASAGSFFPLVTDPDIERDLGTRHRAAIGLSSETDAAIVVVSEETGTISVALAGEITRGLDATSLHNTLLDALGIKRPKLSTETPTLKKEKSEQANT